MIDIIKILTNPDINEKINSLKERSTTVPKWETLVKDYEPSEHTIVTDTQGRKDKHHSDGTTDKAARLAIGLEKLLTKRMSEFTFSIPVKRIYLGTNTPVRQEIAKAIERIYQVAHIDAENKRRGVEYYASCEATTIWYTQRTSKPHTLYGFPCNHKLKCKTFSPMEGTTLYPLIDEYGEMHAMSYEYRKKVKDVYETHFRTFTATNQYEWKSAEGADWEEVPIDDEVPIGKIPLVYIYRDAPIWKDLTDIRQDIEYTISRNSDVIAYNSAPILKVAGALIGEENKGETRRIYRVEEGGDVSYVSWQQSIAALQYHVKSLLDLFFMQAQIPDISFENMKSLGNIGYDARKMLLTDAHMKVEDESGAWLEFLEREGSIIKAFLKMLNTSWKEEDIDAVMIEHKITPYIQEDEMQTITKWQTASGGSPLVSPLEAIKKANLSDDPDTTWNTIQQLKNEANTNE